MLNCYFSCCCIFRTDSQSLVLCWFDIYNHGTRWWTVGYHWYFICKMNSTPSLSPFNLYIIRHKENQRDCSVLLSGFVACYPLLNMWQVLHWWLFIVKIWSIPAFDQASWASIMHRQVSYLVIYPRMDIIHLLNIQTHWMLMLLQLKIVSKPFDCLSSPGVSSSLLFNSCR